MKKSRKRSSWREYMQDLNEKEQKRSRWVEYMQDLNEKEQKKEQQAGIYAEFNS
jgi:hypothetical protein